MASKSRLPPALRLRQLLADKSNIIVAPGVFDGLSARAALSIGFDALYMTGAGTSMSRTGLADLGLTTATEMVDTARMIANLDPSIPLIADADTGYGSALNVHRTVANYIQAGVAAFHLEDQVVNKKCGHLEGKQCVSTEEYLHRIRAAHLTRKKLGSDIIIIARTDALQQLGLEEAIARLKAAVQAGADVAFLEAATKREECKKFCKAFEGSGVPLMYGMVQGSKAYQMSADEAYAMGYSIVVYAAVNLLPAFEGMHQAMSHLKEQRHVESFYDESTVHRRFDAFGMADLMEFDKEISSRID